jgi:hypothetical protein
MFILIRLTQHVSDIIMPIVRRTDYTKNCVWCMPGCVGCSPAELGHELCALCEIWYTKASIETCRSRDDVSAFVTLGRRFDDEGL